MKIVNLTGGRIVTNEQEIPPDGKPAAIVFSAEWTAESSGILISPAQFVRINNLPEPVDEVLYVVPLHVALAVAQYTSRVDVIFPIASRPLVDGIVGIEVLRFGLMAPHQNAQRDAPLGLSAEFRSKYRDSLPPRPLLK